MRWFKHMTASWDDEKLSQLVDKAGLEGYGFWWRIVEIVGVKLDEKNDTSVTFPVKKWGSLLGLSPKKFQTLAELCSNFGILQASFDKNGCTINIPNILKFRDEWTERKAKNSGVTREKLSPSRARSSDPDTEKEKIYNTPPKNQGTDPEQKPVIEGRGISQEDIEPFQTAGDATCGIEFAELRELYDREGVEEAPMSGHVEFLGLCKKKQWPGLGRIAKALVDFEQDHQWTKENGRYRPGLAKFLREQWWLKKPIPAKAREPTQKSTGYKTAAEKRSENVSAIIAMVERAKEIQAHGDTSENSGGPGEFGNFVQQALAGG